jgi:predicted dehydrogenase
MDRIVLFGTGNLGKRYIQAISKTENVELMLFDISDKALRSVPEFIEKNNIKNLKNKLLESFSIAFSSINDTTIVIVSTTLSNRLELLKSIIEMKPRALICEKPVVQTNSDYLKLLELLQIHKVITYVDFTLRMQPFYRRIKTEIGNPSSGVLISNLPKLGLACVGIHQIDLFFWLFNLQECTLSSSAYEDIYEQKRAGYFDVTGSIELLKNGFKAYISNSSLDNLRTSQIIVGNDVYMVYEDQRVITKVSGSKMNVVESEVIEYAFVSQYMSEIINNILLNHPDIITLPNIENSYNQHKVLFDYFENHSIIKLNFT